MMNFSDDTEQSSEYFGLLSRGKRYFLSRFVNVNEGKQTLVEMTREKAEEIQKEKSQRQLMRLLETLKVLKSNSRLKPPHILQAVGHGWLKMERESFQFFPLPIRTAQ